MERNVVAFFFFCILYTTKVGGMAGDYPTWMNTVNHRISNCKLWFVAKKRPHCSGLGINIHAASRFHASWVTCTLYYLHIFIPVNLFHSSLSFMCPQRCPTEYLLAVS